MAASPPRGAGGRMTNVYYDDDDERVPIPTIWVS